MSKATTHALIRTSPMGGPFVGYCMLCGKEGLELNDALRACPNPNGVSLDQALLDAVEGEKP